MDLRVKGSSWPPCLHLQLMEPWVRRQSASSIPLNPVTVPAVNRVDLKQQERTLLKCTIFCQELVLEREAEVAREHCGVELANLVRVVHTTHRCVSDALALVELRVAVLQESIHLVVVNVLKKPPLIWEHDFKHDVSVLRLKSLHGVDLANAGDSVVHVVDCLLDHCLSHPLDSVRWRFHEASSH